MRWEVGAAIEIRGISKRYLLGGLDRRYVTLREHALRSLRGLFWRRAEDRDRERHVWAVRDITLSIDRGSVLGLIGPNGSGKTTLLKILSRITNPTLGCARINGRVGSLLEVGTGFHPELSGRDNIYLSGAVLGLRRNEVHERFDEIVEFAGTERFLDTPVKHYSSGMYVRLGFAVAAHLEPEILLVDEVLAVGDLAFQKKCLDKMATVADGGRTVVFVSHNLAAVQRICGQAVLLTSGRVVAAGPVGEVVDRYVASVYGDGADGSRSQFSVAFLPGSAPGDTTVRLSSVELFSPEGDGAPGTFRIDQKYVIRVRFEALESLSNFHIYLRVFREDGTLAFCTADWDGGEALPNNLPLGNHEASVTIPPHTLNTGEYYLDVRGIVPSIRVVFHVPHAVRWRILAQGGAGGVESVARPGIMRPLLRWRLGSRREGTA